MTFTFTRQDSSGKRYTDLDILLGDSVRFDLFYEESQCGVLMTNQNKTYGAFKKGISFYKEKHNVLFPRSKYIFYNKNDIEYARMILKRPWLGLKEIIYMQFPGDDSVYKHDISFAKRKEAYDFIVNITKNNLMICTIKNDTKGKLFKSDVYRNLRGTIEVNSDHTEKILVFLFMTQFYFWLRDMPV